MASSSGGPKLHGLPKRPQTVMPPTGAVATSNPSSMRTGTPPTSSLLPSAPLRSNSGASSSSNIKGGLLSNQPSYQRSTSPAVPLPALANAPPVPVPHTLDADSLVFLPQIPLPERAFISYRQFGPLDGTPDPHLAIELVRRRLLSLSSDGGDRMQSDSPPQLHTTGGLLEGFLSIVRAENTSLSIWVFVISSEAEQGALTSQAGGVATHPCPALDALQFENIHVMRNGSFAPVDLYPCSPDCMRQAKACPQCIIGSSPTNPSGSSSSSLLPRPNLRIPYAAFLDAIRGRLVDSISAQQLSRSESEKTVSVFRLADGLVLGHSLDSTSPAGSGSPWSTGWSGVPEALTHCYLHISLFPRRIFVQPIFRRIPMIFFSPVPSAVNPGAPITMLPYGTPAHYVGPFVGDTARHREEFADNLSGLGCSDWDDGTFVVCWITVRNRSSPLSASTEKTSPVNGERGVAVVWPRSLCLVVTSPSRPSLVQLPTISPQICAPVSPPRVVIKPVESPLQETAVLESFRFQPRKTNEEDIPTRQRRTVKSSLAALKSLTVEGSTAKYGADLVSVADEMTSYVDWVVKERERERDRLTKEKERQRKEGEKSAGRQRINANASSSRLGLPGAGSRTLNPLSDPQGYYPSPPDFDSPTASQDPNRASALETGTPLVPSLVTPSDSQPTTAFAQPPGLTSAHPASAAPLDDDMALGMEEDVTEDDFSFWDMGGDPPAKSKPSPPKSTPTVPNAPPLPLATDNQGPSPEHRSSPVRKNTDSSQNLPLSPAQTPPPAIASPESSVHSEDSIEDADESGRNIDLHEPPSFRWSVKEHVPTIFQPIPVSVASLRADFKYNAPGAKYALPLSTGPSPSPTPPIADPIKSEEPVVNIFIQSASPVNLTIPSSLPAPLKGMAAQIIAKRAHSSRDLSGVEAFRSRKRADARMNLERPARQGSFEVWHSKKFVDKFSTGTDPRVTHVKRLRGQKRNLEYTPYSYLRTEQDGDSRNTWRGWVEFKDVLPTVDQDATSDATSDDEAVDSLLLGVDSDPETAASDEPRSPGDVKQEPDRRAFTPPPVASRSSGPFGAFVLQTLFQPQHVHDIAGPQSAVMESFGNYVNAPAPVSVPTPVSPDTRSVQVGESARLLEAAAEVLTREAVENPEWARDRRSTLVPRRSQQTQEVIVKYISGLFGLLPWLGAAFSLHSLTQFNDSSLAVSDPSLTPDRPILTITKPPLFAIAQGDSIMHLAPPSVRFWDKLGLNPLHGPKNVIAFALFDEHSLQSDHKFIETLPRWLRRLGRVYEALGFGKHELGHPDTAFPDGMVPFSWDAVKRPISQILGALQKDITHVLFYLIVGISSASPTSRDFKQLSGVITNSQNSLSELDERVTFQFVSPSAIFNNRAYPQTKQAGLERLASSVYDRLLQKVQRDVPRQVFKRQTLRVPRYFQAPSYTLARDSPKFSFVLMDWPPASDDVADRHSLLHVAYTFSSNRDWVFVAAIDERGEAHKLKAWYLGASQSEEEVYDKMSRRIVSFIWEFVGRVQVEWSVVIVSWGAMTELELGVWDKCLRGEIYNQETAIHFTVACADDRGSLLLWPTHHPQHTSPSISGQPALQKSPFQDLAAIAMSLIPSHRPPLLVGDTTFDFVSKSSLELDWTSPLNPSDSTSVPPRMGLLPMATAFIIQDPSQNLISSYPSVSINLLRAVASPTSSFRKPFHIHLQEISKNYCSLATLGRERWDMLSYGLLPVHLSAVDIMRRVMASSAPV